jgi:hypothetical protein
LSNIKEITSLQVLLHEIAFVKRQNVDEILRELGDWVHDDEEDDTPQEGPSSTVSLSHYVYMYCMYCIILINNNQGSKSPSTATAIVC